MLHELTKTEGLILAFLTQITKLDVQNSPKNHRASKPYSTCPQQMTYGLFFDAHVYQNIKISAILGVPRLDYQPLFREMSPLGEERRPDPRERRKSSLGGSLWVWGPDFTRSYLRVCSVGTGDNTPGTGRDWSKLKLGLKQLSIPARQSLLSLYARDE